MSTNGPREKAVFCQALEISDVEQLQKLGEGRYLATQKPEFCEIGNAVLCTGRTPAPTR